MAMVVAINVVFRRFRKVFSVISNVSGFVILAFLLIFFGCRRALAVLSEWSVCSGFGSCINVFDLYK